MYLATTRLGDTLVSVGMDKVAKVWRLSRGLLYPVRWVSLNHGVTAACLTRDNHLLLASGARIQEVQLLPGEAQHVRQGHSLGAGGDPVMEMMETEAMGVLACTRYDHT